MFNKHAELDGISCVLTGLVRSRSQWLTGKQILQVEVLRSQWDDANKVRTEYTEWRDATKEDNIELDKMNHAVRRESLNEAYGGFGVHPGGTVL